MKSIKEYTNLKRTSLDKIRELYNITDYNTLYDTVLKLIAEGEIVPIKSSKFNGMNRPLYNRYRILNQQEDDTELKEELLYQIHSRLTIDYYINHLEQYKIDRENVLLLSDYMKVNGHKLSNAISINERSFEIFGREKFLTKEKGKTLLNRLKIELSDLNVYPTTEPLRYYSKHKEAPQGILIVENKDTFFSMRKYLIEGHDQLLGVSIGTLVYGKGMGIIKSFQDFEYCVEPYLSDKRNSIYYLGDLDYVGITIFEGLQKAFYPSITREPFIPGYVKMIDKANELPFPLPLTKKGQKERDIKEFINYFDSERQKMLLEILKKRRYIPQEILNQGDF